MNAASWKRRGKTITVMGLVALTDNADCAADK